MTSDTFRCNIIAPCVFYMPRTPAKKVSLQFSIEKRPVVAEEVLVSKRGIQEHRRFTDTVRREEVRMERQGNVTVHGDAVEEVAPRQEEQEMDRSPVRVSSG